MTNFSKQKVLICTPIYPPDIGGPATYTKELCERLNDKYDISILTYGISGESPTFPNTKLNIISKKHILPIRLFLYTFKLLQISKNFKVIYVQNAMAAGLPVAINKILLGTPFILKFVGDEAWERATQSGQTTMFLEDFLEDQHLKTPKEKMNFRIKLFLMIQGFVLRKANLVTTPSQYLGEALVKNYRVKEENFLVNYNASESEARTLEIDPIKKDLQICTTARLTKWKNVDGILEAIKILIDTKNEIYKNLNLAVAGDGPELNNLIEKRKKMNLEDNVRFLGKVTREDTYRLRKESAAYILNSTYEGLPHTALTCFQAAIPIIATNTPGTNEAVYHEVSGLLVPVNSPEKLAEAIDRIIIDQKNGGTLSKKLVEGGSKLLNEKFSWESHIQNLETFFQKVLQK